MQNKKIIILIVAVAVVGAVGVVAWMNYRMVAPIVAPAPSKTPYVNIFANPPADKSLEELFNAEPESNATPDKVVEYYFLVSKQAVSASSVDIGGCISNPAVIRMKSGDILVFNNNDSVGHRLLSSEWDMVVPANSKTEIKIEGGGVKKYFCDNQPAGMIFVTR